MEFLAHWSTKLNIGNKTLMSANRRGENFQNEGGDDNQFGNGSQDFGGLITLRTATPTLHENVLSVRSHERTNSVEHRAGKKIPLVDALSRHIGLVQDSPTLSRQTITKKQELDPFSSTQRRIGFSSKSEFFSDLDGVVYRRQRENPMW
jgi:hypothetical protein